MKQLDFYEFSGITAPGVVVITTSLLSTMEPKEAIAMNLGASFFAFIIAYIVGHVIQALGNWFESLWWRLFGGMPTDWVRFKAEPILSQSQREKLFSAIEQNEGLSRDAVSKISGRDWFSLVRSLYVTIQASGSVERIERFNGNYGLLRGTTVACLVSAIVIFVTPSGKWEYGVALIIASILALLRMHRFAKYYARELFLQYLKCT